MFILVIVSVLPPIGSLGPQQGAGGVPDCAIAGEDKSSTADRQNSDTTSFFISVSFMSIGWLKQDRAVYLRALQARTQRPEHPIRAVQCAKDVATTPGA